ncbi:MAG TPA: vitamin K epoxide reductase family protein [Gaiellaceae bacterium]|nr:vitamin K epoxide reductase family protein [Gaiellaceae bacterium]
MSQRALRAAVAVLALAGAAVAGYLTWVRYSGATIACTTGGCETVQSSSYSELVGVPVALLGLLGYLAIAASALRETELFRIAGAAVALAAAGFGAYLLVVQIAVIGAVCDWCLTSDAIAAALAVVTVLRLRAWAVSRTA